MLKFIFFTVAFFFLVRFINRLFLPTPKRQSHFNPFYNPVNRKRSRIDHIEEAEYEDLSEKEK